MLVAFLAPAALATTANPLPACCRVRGRHHCSAMTASMVPGGARVQGQSCPYRKPVAFSVSVAPPPATGRVVLADAHPFSNEFHPELFASRGELAFSQRGPPASAVK